jgi:hypothetical protein
MRDTVQTIGRWGPVAMSAAAVVLLAVALTTGWDRGLKDEGAVAHLWQLLIALQAPLVAAFLLTADWRRPVRIGGALALQAAALACAMAPVAIFRL